MDSWPRPRFCPSLAAQVSQSGSVVNSARAGHSAGAPTARESQSAKALATVSATTVQASAL